MTAKTQITRVSAYGLVVKDQHVLLCRISSQLPELAGHWTLPGGGIDFREDPVAAMVREVEEETGLIVRNAGLAAVDANAVDTEDTSYHGIRIIYHTTVVGGALRNEVDGTTDLCKFWHWEELPELPVVDLVHAGLAHLP